MDAKKVRQVNLLVFVISLVLFALLICSNFKIRFYFVYTISLLLFVLILILPKFVLKSNKFLGLRIVSLLTLGLIILIGIFSVLEYGDSQGIYYTYDSDGVLTKYTHNYYGKYIPGYEWNSRHSCHNVIFLKSYYSEVVSTNCSIVSRGSTVKEERMVSCEDYVLFEEGHSSEIRQFITFEGVRDFVSQDICDSEKNIFLDYSYYASDLESSLRHYDLLLGKNYLDYDYAKVLREVYSQN